jgi:sulfatase maturation enzyme AslB (radical SAM superfamily)
MKALNDYLTILVDDTKYINLMAIIQIWLTIWLKKLKIHVTENLVSNIVKSIKRWCVHRVSCGPNPALRDGVVHVWAQITLTPGF